MNLSKEVPFSQTEKIIYIDDVIDGLESLLEQTSGKELDETTSRRISEFAERVEIFKIFGLELTEKDKAIIRAGKVSEEWTDFRKKVEQALSKARRLKVEGKEKVELP